MINKRPAVISLFAGAGGLDMGFERHGYKTVWESQLNSLSQEQIRLCIWLNGMGKIK